MTIKQRFDGNKQRHDCFVCCVAMACGMDYDELWSSLDDELRKRICETGTYGGDDDKIFLAAGMTKVMVGARRGNPTDEPGDYFVLFISPEYATPGFIRNTLWGRRALVQVRSKNFAEEMHIVYWDGRRLHDPSNLRCYEWSEVNPVFLWLFREDIRSDNRVLRNE